MNWIVGCLERVGVALKARLIDCFVFVFDDEMEAKEKEIRSGPRVYILLLTTMVQCWPWLPRSIIVTGLCDVLRA
jgi:hypothetical protein